MSEESKVIRVEQCPACAASGRDTKKNGLKVYSDGHTYCFKCDNVVTTKSSAKFVTGQVVPIRTRSLSEETCRWFNYQVGQYTGSWKFEGETEKVKDYWVRICNYYDKRGRIIAQKLKDDKKNMTIKGDGKNLPLYGMWKYEPNDKLRIVVTEGEEDCLAVAQACGVQYPVVSIPNGANSAAKHLKEHSKYLSGFKYIVLAFDNDEAGQQATEECLALPCFEYGKLRVAQFPEGYKDANDMIKDGESETLEKILWNARIIAPDAIVTVSDVIEEVMEQPQYGLPYPWKSMTKATYGQQFGEIHIWVAANGIGKTEVIKDVMFHFLDPDSINAAADQLDQDYARTKSGQKLGLFSFEQKPANTLRRLAGAKLGLRLHLPGSEWPEDKIRGIVSNFNDNIYLCNRTGSISLEELFQCIRYLATAKDVKLFVIDNIRGLGIGHDTETAGTFMRKLQAMCLELQINVHLLSHVAKDKYNTQVYTSTSPKNEVAYADQTVEDVESLIKKPGMDWESGRMPNTVNVDGPSVFCDLADYVWCLARNKISDDYDESHTLRIKPAKTRLDGEYTGKIFKLFLTPEGKYEEISSGNGTAY